MVRILLTNTKEVSERDFKEAYDNILSGLYGCAIARNYNEEEKTIKEIYASAIENEKAYDYILICTVNAGENILIGIHSNDFSTHKEIDPSSLMPIAEKLKRETYLTLKREIQQCISLGTKYEGKVGVYLLATYLLTKGDLMKEFMQVLEYSAPLYTTLAQNVVREGYTRGVFTTLMDGNSEELRNKNKALDEALERLNSDCPFTSNITLDDNNRSYVYEYATNVLTSSAIITGLRAFNPLS